MVGTPGPAQSASTQIIGSSGILANGLSGVAQSGTVTLSFAGGPPGSVAFWDSSNTLTGSPSFTWDESNKALTVDSVRLHAHGTDSLFLGAAAGNFTNTGTSNTGVGQNAFASLTTATDSTAVGFNAATLLQDGSLNVAIGSQAMRSAVSSIRGTAVGTNSLANTFADSNTAIGYASGFGITSGTRNVCLGEGTLHEPSTSADCVAVGFAALHNCVADKVTAVGANALFALTVGTPNDAFGYATLGSLTIGSNNAAFGAFSLGACVSGIQNSAFGVRALVSCTSDNNSAFGYFALLTLSTGVQNTAIGEAALVAANGNNNTAVGRAAGATLTTGSSCTFLGSGADVSAGGLNLASAIGFGAVVSTSATTVIGGTGGNAVTVIFPGLGVQVGAPVGGDKGTGTINVSGDIYKNNLAYTSPDYVLESWATGRIERFSENEGAKAYKGVMALEAVEDYCRRNFRLPGISDEPAGMFSRSDKALEKIEEIFTYLFDMQRQLKAMQR